MEICLIAVVPPHSAVETHREAYEQSDSMHDDRETTEAIAKERAAHSDADAVVVRVPNLRKVRVLTG